MRRCISFALILSALTQGELSAQSSPGFKDESQSTLRIDPSTKNLPTALRRFFTKQITVFGIKVLATQKTPDNKMLHAANVLAQYLDNDENGEPDNPQVIRAMQKNRATLVIFATERDARRVFAKLERIDTEPLDAMVLQDLYAEETHPGGASRGIFDASYEEVLHLITHAGYASAYPKVFGEKPDTDLGDAMDKARGGRFLEIPNVYPKTAWYSYYDETCDYGCQATEYIYWGLTSLLGAQNFPGRHAQIKDEWRLSTPQAFKESDPSLYSLLADEQYRFPTSLPDGKYRPKRN